MFNYDIINNRLFSFHLSGSFDESEGEKSDDSFAIFGGSDPSQYVGDFQEFPLVNTLYWSLGIEMIAFGNDILATFGSGTAFAVIDTGTTMIGLPEAVFKSLQSKWLK